MVNVSIKVVMPGNDFPHRVKLHKIVINLPSGCVIVKSFIKVNDFIINKLNFKFSEKACTGDI